MCENVWAGRSVDVCERVWDRSDIFSDFKRLNSPLFFVLNSLDLLTKLFKSPLCDFNSPGHDEHDVQEKNRSPYRRTIWANLGISPVPPVLLSSCCLAVFLPPVYIKKTIWKKFYNNMTANETQNKCAFITKLIVKLTINRIKIIFTSLIIL